jgi:Fur family transcriptional regulator, iron response regulator
MNSVRAQALQQRLSDVGIVPTLQRMAVAHVLLAAPVHMTAEQVLDAARDYQPGLSRATVYAALRLFVHHGLLRELPIDGAAAVYDSNPSPHHHLYDVDTGEVADVPLERLQVRGLDSALQGLELVGVDVVVRVHGLSRRTADATVG